MKANRRRNCALVAELEFERAIHAPSLFSAAVAYFCRSANDDAMDRPPHAG
jgi:hypothetical protein